MKRQKYSYYRHTWGTVLTRVWFNPSKRIQHLPAQTETDGLVEEFFIRSTDVNLSVWPSILNTTCTALESICLINRGLQSLTSGSQLMSAFVWVWRQTKGKANPTIVIISAWNQIEEASERGRDRQRKWRKRTMGILAIMNGSNNNNIQIKERDECSHGRLAVDNATFSFYAQSMSAAEDDKHSGAILWED